MLHGGDWQPVRVFSKDMATVSKGATLSLARRAKEPGHLLHSVRTCPSGGNARHLNSRHPFVRAAQRK